MPRATDYRLPVGLVDVDVPTGPGLCETCRGARRREGSPYCSELCRLFDQAMTSHRAALILGDDELAVRTRTALRIVAIVYDERAGLDDPASRWPSSALHAWIEDAAAGRVLDVNVGAAVGELRARIAVPVDNAE